MNFDALDRKRDDKRLNREKQDLLWQNEKLNAERVVELVHLFFEKHKADFESRDIPVKINDEKIYLRVEIGRINQRIEVFICYINERFYICANKDTLRLLEFERALDCKWTYEQLDNYFEKLITKHLK
ncbi:MAG: hypothetical protein LC105_06140 [Chitinophagales bacterium]|nr:hypothetical protein [Chitinophagales bacterium]